MKMVNSHGAIFTELISSVFQFQCKQCNSFLLSSHVCLETYSLSSGSCQFQQRASVHRTCVLGCHQMNRHTQKSHGCAFMAEGKYTEMLLFKKKGNCSQCHHPIPQNCKRGLISVFLLTRNVNHLHYNVKYHLKTCCFLLLCILLC